VVLVPATSVTVVEKSLDADHCHFVTLPVCPLRENVTVLPAPVQIGLAVVTATVPPTEAVFTLIVATLLLAGAHTPLVTTARKKVFWVIPVARYVVFVAPLISVKLVLSVEDCHWIVPRLLFKVSVVLLLVAQTVVPPDIVPPNEVGSTVMVAALLNEVQAPFTITARK
jgi:hypothetical protein